MVTPAHAKGNYSDQHTLGHLDCPPCEKSRFLSLHILSPTLPFRTASAIWLESRSFRTVAGQVSARYIRKTTEDSYEQYVASLLLFFADMPLEKIHLGHIRQYQEARVTGAEPFHRKRRPNKSEEVKACPASPKKCNQELSILKMILRRAQCWSKELDEFYQPFREAVSDIPRALSVTDRKLWLDVCLCKERWHLVYWYSVLAFETSMSTNEERSLRIGDVSLYQRMVNIGDDGAKNEYRARTIPLHSAEVVWAAEQLLERAKDIGSVSPQHYLFPLGQRGGYGYDPTKPMTSSGIKMLWNEVRAASGLKWFRQYDTRHTAITHWAESGVNPEIIRSMAGHVTERMMRHYTHISLAAQRRALEAALPKIGPHAMAAPFYVRQKAQ